MPEYISREAVLKHLNECKEDPFFDTDMARICSAISIFIEEMQAADVQPIVYAHKTINIGRRSYCSNCGKLAIMEDFCSKCGAKVKEGAAE